MTVEPMSAVDTAWLHMDRPTNLMVVHTIVWTDEPLDERALRGVVQSRLVDRFRRFRQRAEDPAVTLGAVAAPQWVADPAFSLDRHLSVHAVPDPGDEQALQQLAAELASRPLSRDRSLWELHLLTGYRGGSALLLRTHHAIADGGALMQVLMSLTDRVDGGEHAGLMRLREDDADARGTRAGATWSRLTSVAGAAGAQAAGLGAHVLGAVGDPRAALEQARTDGAMLTKLGFGVNPPRNRLQGDLVADKRLAWTRTVPLAAAKRAGRESGCTINDLMLTAITGAFRRYLAEHDGLVDEVVAIVPVDLRPKDAPLSAGLGNAFGLLFVELPTGEPDRRARQALVKRRMDRIKSSREGAFVFSMLQLMGQIPTPLQNRWLDAFSGKGTAIVTNITGPQHQVALAGTPITGAMAWVPVTGPVGLGLSVFSYDGRLALGLASDAQLLPDRDRFLALLDEELEPLRARGPVAPAGQPQPSGSASSP